MTSWWDESELLRDLRIFSALGLVLIGVATWEVVVTFAFDWSIITGRRRWRWTMVLYFLCRIGIFLPIWAITIQNTAIAEVNCAGLGWTNKISEAIGMCVASGILALRTYAVWGQDRIIGCVLLALWVGQVALWTYLVTFWTSTWSPVLMVCEAVRMPAPASIYVATFSYTVGFDAFVLAAMVLKLFRHAKAGGIGALLLNDGISYFIASVLANGTAMVFASLNLNPVMALMGVPFASVMCPIAATRLFRHAFEEFDSLSSENQVGSVESPIAFRSGVINPSRNNTLVVDIQRMRPSEGAMTLNEMDVERDAESEFEQDQTHRVSEQSCHDPGGSAKTYPL